MTVFRPGDRVLVNHGRGEIEAEVVWATSRGVVVMLSAFVNERVFVYLDRVRHDPRSHGEGLSRELPPREPTYTETLEAKIKRLEESQAQDQRALKASVHVMTAVYSLRKDGPGRQAYDMARERVAAHRAALEGTKHAE